MQVAEPYLGDMGYSITWPESTQNSSGIITLTVRVVCPVCSTRYESHERFKNHLWSAHLFHGTGNGAGALSVMEGRAGCDQLLASAEGYCCITTMEFGPAVAPRQCEQYPL